MSEEKQSHFAGEEASLEALAAKQDCDLSIDDIEELKHLKMLQSQMADFLIERFQNNLETFKKYMPDVAKTFETYRPKRTMEFFCAQNGIPNLIFPDTNDILYKTFDPFELCKKQVDFVLNKNNIRQVKYPHEWDPFGQIHFKFQNQAINIEESVERDRTISPKEIGSLPNVVLIGIGLGYQLANLYENIEIANLLIVEPDLDMFYASMHSFDWKNLLEFLFEKKYGVHIMLGQTPRQERFIGLAVTESAGREIARKEIQPQESAPDVLAKLKELTGPAWMEMHRREDLSHLWMDDANTVLLRKMKLARRNYPGDVLPAWNDEDVLLVTEDFLG